MYVIHINSYNIYCSSSSDATQSKLSGLLTSEHSPANRLSIRCVEQPVSGRVTPGNNRLDSTYRSRLFEFTTLSQNVSVPGRSESRDLVETHPQYRYCRQRFDHWSRLAAADCEYSNEWCGCFLSIAYPVMS